MQTIWSVVGLNLLTNDVVTYKHTIYSANTNKATKLAKEHCENKQNDAIQRGEMVQYSAICIARIDNERAN